MTTIAYDQPVADFIDELDDTGHVTHSKWNKTSVTFHHNGGRLSHQGVLNVWKVRPASAHFDSDAKGAIAQYVRVHEYAWACGNTLGNQRSISIEMCNATLSPGWTVAEATWKSAARLAGWLFAYVIKAAPTRSNVLFHHNWLATECAGPYMDKVYDDLLEAVQAAYAAFKGHPTPTPPKPAPGPAQWYIGPKTGKALQDRARSTGHHDGYFDTQPAGNRALCPNVTCIRWVSTPHPSPGVIAVQRMVGVHDDGYWGHDTNVGLQRWAGMPRSEWDGVLGNKSAQAICNKLGLK